VGGCSEGNLYLPPRYDYLDTRVAPSRGTAPRGLDPGDGIRFRNVSFGYPGAEQPVLTNVNLHIPPGTSLALVGENMKSHTGVSGGPSVAPGARFQLSTHSRLARTNSR